MATVASNGSTLLLWDTADTNGFYLYQANQLFEISPNTALITYGQFPQKTFNPMDFLGVIQNRALSYQPASTFILDESTLDGADLLG